MEKITDILHAFVTLAPYLIIAVLAPMLVLHAVPAQNADLIKDIVVGSIGMATGTAVAKVTAPRP